MISSRMPIPILTPQDNRLRLRMEHKQEEIIFYTKEENDTNFFTISLFRL
jgi:hypothetical protein